MADGVFTGVILPSEERNRTDLWVQGPKKRRVSKCAESYEGWQEFDRSLDKYFPDSGQTRAPGTRDPIRFVDPPPSVKLYPWQLSVIRSIQQAFMSDDADMNHRRAIMAGFSEGKSFLSLILAITIRSPRPVLIITLPGLVDQTKTLIHTLGRPCTILGPKTEKQRATPGIDPVEANQIKDAKGNVVPDLPTIFISSIESFSLRDPRDTAHGYVVCAPTFSMAIVDEYTNLGETHRWTIAGLDCRVLMVSMEAPPVYLLTRLEFPSHVAMEKFVLKGGGAPLPAIKTYVHDISVPGGKMVPKSVEDAGRISAEWAGFRIRELDRIQKGLAPGQKMIVVVPDEQARILEAYRFGTFDGHLRIAAYPPQTQNPFPGVVCLSKEGSVSEDAEILPDDRQPFPSVRPGTMASVVYTFVSSSKEVSLRVQEINTFRSDKTRNILFVSARSILNGYNLQWATVMIFFGPVLTKSEYDSLVARCCRPRENASSEPVHVHIIRVVGSHEMAEVLYYEYERNKLLKNMQEVVTRSIKS